MSGYETIIEVDDYKPWNKQAMHLEKTFLNVLKDGYEGDENEESIKTVAPFEPPKEPNYYLNIILLLVILLIFYACFK